MNTVLPFIIFSIASCKTFSEWLSSDAVASSKTRISVPIYRSCYAFQLLCPPENDVPLSPATVFIFLGKRPINGLSRHFHCFFYLSISIDSEKRKFLLRVSLKVGLLAKQTKCCLILLQFILFYVPTIHKDSALLRLIKP